MDLHWNEDEIQEIIKLNGRAIIGVLANIKNNATAAEVSDYIINHTGLTRHTDLVNQEVKRVLDNGVRDGFMVKVGNKYALPSLEDVYQLDADEGEEYEDTSADEAGAVGCNSPLPLDPDMHPAAWDRLCDDPSLDRVVDGMEAALQAELANQPIINVQVDLGGSNATPVIDVQVNEISSSTTDDGDKC